MNRSVISYYACVIEVAVSTQSFETKEKKIPEVQNKSNGIDYLVKILIASLYSVQTFPLDGFCAIPL